MYPKETEMTVMGDVESPNELKAKGVLNADLSATIHPVPSPYGTQKKRRQTIVLCVAVLATLAVAIGVTVGVKQKNKKEAADISSLQAPQVQTDGEKNSLVEGAIDTSDVVIDEIDIFYESELDDGGEPVVLGGLAEVCNPLNIITTEGYQECQGACEDAKDNYGCCGIPSGREGSCLDTADDILACKPVLPCASLKVASLVFSGNLAMAPPTLGETCKGGDFDECELICKTASCCNLDGANEGGCLSLDNLAACASYLPCGSAVDFADSITKGDLAPAPEDISAKCQSTSILTENGRKDCEQACAPSDCCSLEPANSDSCLTWGNIASCATYFPCGSLNIVDSVSGGSLPMADETLRQTCLDEDKQEDCNKMCERASCCRSDTEESCLDLSNVMACASYWPCEAANLIDAIADGNDPIDLLDSILEGSHIPTILNDFLGGPNPNPVIESILDGDVITAPNDLLEICSSQEEADKQECSKQCEPARCCLDPLNLASFGLANCDSVNCESFVLHCPRDVPVAITDGETNVDDKEEDGVPPARSDLCDICPDAVSNIISLFNGSGPSAACKEECEKAACCQGVLNWISDCPSDENCDGYSCCPII
mmetsp:Transcript_26084/g.38601  ORF Transcript_26084/g.38601 Transcript_26084/m.38601 type:complete len:603 (-) Transcript_26084:226-2034(-)